MLLLLDPSILSSRSAPAQGFAATRWYHQVIQARPGKLAVHYSKDEARPDLTPCTEPISGTLRIAMQ